MVGKVLEWTMTEEERLAYIEKNPIKVKKRKGTGFSLPRDDYKWRGARGAASRWGKDRENNDSSE